jgi:hypothetical protein
VQSNVSDCITQDIVGTYTLNRCHIGEASTPMKRILLFPCRWPLGRVCMNGLFKCTTEMSASTPNNVSGVVLWGELALSLPFMQGRSRFVHVECTYSTSFFRFKTSPSKAQSNLSI